MKNKVFGTYRIAASLNKTATHTLYLARHPTGSEWNCALKLFASHLFTASQHQEAFTQEIQELTRLRHPHILPLHEAGIEDGTPYIAMEYAAHGSLQDRMSRHATPLEYAEILSILTQIGQALHYAHEQNRTYGNLKPGNILFTAPDTVCLADFRLLNIEVLNTKNTGRYIAPEEHQGSGDPSSDQWALGCLAYELFTGHTLQFTQEKKLTKDVAALSQTRRQIPPELDAILLKALDPDPSQRFPDVLTFIDTLSALPVPANEPVSPTAKTDPNFVVESGTYVHTTAPRSRLSAGPGKRWTRRMTILATCLLVIVMVVMIRIFTPVNQAPPDPRVHYPTSTPIVTPTLIQQTPTPVEATATIVPTIEATPTPEETAIPQPTATQPPTPQPTPTPTPQPTSPPQIALLQGTLSSTPPYVNLSQEGSTDWIHWGHYSASHVERKQGENVISDCSIIGNQPLRQFSDNPALYGWYNGHPTRDVSMTRTGIFLAGEGHGFSITIPANTTQRTLRIFVGVYAGQGRFSASLNDGSTPEYVDTSINNRDGTSIGVYTITYGASQPGQVLTITYTLQKRHNPDGNVTLQAASLR